MQQLVDDRPTADKYASVSYAIIFCNLLVPQIERFTRPVAFGKGGAKK